MCGGYLAQDTTDFWVLDIFLDNWTDKMRLMNAEDATDSLLITNIVRERCQDSRTDTRLSQA